MLGFLPIAVGVLLQLAVVFKSTDPGDSFTLGLFAASCVGFVLCLIALLVFTSSLPGALGACFAIVPNAILYNEIFFHPHSSTAAIGLLGVPIVNTGLSILGIVVGWIAVAVARRRASAHPKVIV
jgi:hypothetical protein